MLGAATIPTLSATQVVRMFFIVTTSHGLFCSRFYLYENYVRSNHTIAT